MTLNEIEGARQRFISDIKDKTLEWKRLSEEYDLNEEKLTMIREEYPNLISKNMMPGKSSIKPKPSLKNMIKGTGLSPKFCSLCQ